MGSVSGLITLCAFVFLTVVGVKGSAVTDNCQQIAVFSMPVESPLASKKRYMLE